MRVQPQLGVLFILICVGARLGKESVLAKERGGVPHNIVFITLDTTRADRMGFLGSKRGLTPNLDALARQSVFFTRAYAQVPLTTPSHATMLTGTYPQFNHLEVLRDSLREDLPYLPELLHDHGYQTGAFVGSLILDPRNGGGKGFDRGFDVYDADFHIPKAKEDRYQSAERRAGEVADRALGWLAGIHQGPFFLWIHFFDPHDPYDPPQPFKARYSSNLYDGEIAYTDLTVGRVIKELQKRGFFDDCLIVVAGDHGEAFGEHGEERHGLLLYDETIHVPLIFKLPGERSAGKRVDTRVALADIAPSMLQETNIEIPARMQGQPLIAQMESNLASKDVKRERAVYSETEYAKRTLGWSELRSWRAGKYLYIKAPKRELYDQISDPRAEKNLAPGASAVASTLDAQLSDFWEKTAARGGDRIKPGTEKVESLHALGYLASEGGSENRVERPSVDPKDKVATVNHLQKALVLMEGNRYEEATLELRKALRDPDAVNAYLEFGIGLVDRKQYQDAVPLLKAAVERLPNSAGARYELGIALINTGRWEAALPQLQGAVALEPASAPLHFYLAAVYTRLRQVPEAIEECKKALAIDPNHFEANLTYGRLLLQSSRPEDALPRLSLAVKLKPESPEAHFFLAEAYQDLGETENAEQERAKAMNLKTQRPK